MLYRHCLTNAELLGILGDDDDIGDIMAGDLCLVIATHSHDYNIGSKEEQLVLTSNGVLGWGRFVDDEIVLANE